VFLPFRKILTDVGKWTDLKELIVIPDGVFQNIPFEPMLIEPTNNKAGYKTLPYLMNKVDIIYQLSGRHYTQAQSKSKSPPRISMLALGPSNSAGLSGAIQEVDYISGLFQNHSVVYRDWKKVLNSSSGKFNIIHIACHADIEPQNYNLNRLRFGNENQDTMTIYNYELRNLELDTKLVLLNACETSKGEQFQGEGVYSFTQSLYLSGANAILSSLWKISDQTSTDLSLKFYKYLQKGNDISKSLTMAKKDYITNAHPEAAHPYYWAYLIANGQTEQYFKKTVTNPLIDIIKWIGLISGISILILLLLKRRTTH